MALNSGGFNLNVAPAAVYDPNPAVKKPFSIADVVNIAQDQYAKAKKLSILKNLVEAEKQKAITSAAQSQADFTLIPDKTDAQRAEAQFKTVDFNDKKQGVIDAPGLPTAERLAGIAVAGAQGKKANLEGLVSDQTAEVQGEYGRRILGAKASSEAELSEQAQRLSSGDLSGLSVQSVKDPDNGFPLATVITGTGAEPAKFMAPNSTLASTMLKSTIRSQPEKDKMTAAYVKATGDTALTKVTNPADGGVNYEKMAAITGAAEGGQSAGEAFVQKGNKVVAATPEVAAELHAQGVPSEFTRVAVNLPAKTRQSVIQSQIARDDKAISELQSQDQVRSGLRDDLVMFKDINKQVDTGPLVGEERVAAIRRIMGPEKSSQYLQLMDSINKKMALLARPKGSGTMSDRDLEIFLQTAVGTDKNRQVNDVMIDGKIAEIDRLNDYGNFLDRYRQFHPDGVLTGANEEWERYQKENPYLTKSATFTGAYQANPARKDIRDWYLEKDGTKSGDAAPQAAASKPATLVLPGAKGKPVGSTLRRKDGTIWVVTDSENGIIAPQ